MMRLKLAGGGHDDDNEPDVNEENSSSKEAPEESAKEPEKDSEESKEDASKNEDGEKEPSDNDESDNKDGDKPSDEDESEENNEDKPSEKDESDKEDGEKAPSNKDDSGENGDKDSFGEDESEEDGEKSSDENPGESVKPELPVDAVIEEPEIEEEVEIPVATPSELMEELPVALQAQYNTKFADKPNAERVYLGVGQSVTFQLEEKGTGELDFFYNESILSVASDEDSVTVTGKRSGVTALELGTESWGMVSATDRILIEVVSEPVVHVQLDANGGEFGNTYNSDTYEVRDAYGAQGGKLYSTSWSPKKGNLGFTGKWYEDPECTKLAIDTNKNYSIPKSLEGKTLYAEYAETIVITWYYDGIHVGQNNMSYSYIPKGRSLDGLEPVFPDDLPLQTNGKLLAGWKNSKDVFMTSEQLKEYCPEDTERLTAVWKDAYAVTFKYGLELNGKSEEICYALPESKLYTIPEAMPDENGNTIFGGWKTERGDILTQEELADYVPDGNETLTAVWEKCYRVSYDANGAIFNSGVKTYQLVPYGSTIKNLPSQYEMYNIPSGMVLNGWLVEGTNEPVNAWSYVPTGDVTLKADWASEYVYVTFDLNGGETTNEGEYYQKRQVRRGNSTYLPSQGYSKQGAIFAGWCEDKDGNGEIYDRYYYPDKDVTLYAQWKEAWEITWDAGEGVFPDGGHIKKEMLEKGTALGYLRNTSTREDAAFEGWYYDSAYTKPVRSGDMIQDNVTFYAKWAEDYCTITIHAGGDYYYDEASGKRVSEAVLKVKRGNAIPYVSVSRSGYTATWYTDPEFTIPYKQASGVYITDYIALEDMDLYVKWDNTIRITWDAKGGYVVSSGSYGYFDCASGQRVNLATRIGIKRDGYAFDGWYTSDGEQVDCTTVFTENTSVTARWTEGCRITLDLDGGTLPYYAAVRFDPDFMVRPGEALHMAYRAEKEGYAFAGWKNSVTGEVVESIYNETVDTDTTFTAQWKQNAYKVTFHAGDGGAIIESSESGVKYYSEKVVWVPAGEKALLNVPTADANGQNGADTQIGWSTTPDGSNIIDVYEYTFTKNMDLYAVYGTDMCTVRFVLNGGTAKDLAYNEVVAYACQRNVPLQKGLRDENMYRKGYTFAGWYENPDFSGEAIHVPDSDYVPTGNVTLYAKWLDGEKVMYRVTFVTNGGTNVKAQDVVGGETLERPENPTKKGYQFTGWYTDQACTQEYDFDEPVEGVLVLYAGWQQIVDLSQAEILSESGEKLEDFSAVYTGEKICPEVTVKFAGVELTEGIDYEVTYGENIRAGEGSVTIKPAQGSSSVEEQTVTFKIEKAKAIPETSAPSTLSLQYGDRVDTIKLPEGWSWKKQYGVLEAGTHTLEVVYTPEDTENYDSITATVEVTVAAYSINGATVEINSNQSFVYTGDPICPSGEQIHVELNGVRLVENKDYQIGEYKANVNAGTAYINIVGIGNYAGTCDGIFQISKAEQTLTITSSYVTNGTMTISTGTPEFALGASSQSGKEVICTVEDPSILSVNSDGSVVKPLKIGHTALNIQIEGDKNYKDGSWTLEVKVTKAENPASVPSEKLTAVYGQKLNEIALSGGWQWENPEELVGDAGVREHTIVLAETEVYQQKKATVKVEVAPIALDVNAFLLNETTYPYTGSLIEPSLVMASGYDYRKDTDYIVEYADNTNAGTGKVILKGINNYQGEKVFEFTIEKPDTKPDDSGNQDSNSNGSGNNSSGSHSSGSRGGSSAGSGSGATKTILPTGYTGSTRRIGNVVVPASVVDGQWSQTETGGWRFQNTEGRTYQNEWGMIYNPYANTDASQIPYDWFMFDETGAMRTGWYTDPNGDTYYLNPVSDNRRGAMVSGWQLIDGKEYYFSEISDGTRGHLVKNDWTPDGWYVDENGVKTAQKR